MISRSLFQEDYRKKRFPVELNASNSPQPWHWHEEFEQLLLSTDEPITVICGRAGFSSVKTLNRQFREIWNMTPTQYRRLNRKTHEKEA